MEKEDIKRVILLVIKIARVTIGVFLLWLFLDELHNIGIDSDTYEKVYTGEFLGEFRYESLNHYKLEIVQIIIFMSIYVLVAFLCFTKIKRMRFFPYIVILIDLCLIIYIGYSVYKILFIMNY